MSAAPTQSQEQGPQADAALAAATMRVAERRGWAALTLADVAAEAGLSLGHAYERARDKPGLLTHFHQEMDRQALVAAEPDLDPAHDSARDRLFALLMARFDAMGPHKAGLKVVLAELPGDPVALLPAWPYLLASMARFLEAAAIPAGGPTGVLKAKGLAGVYIATAWAWLRDDSAEQNATMAALDKNLRRAESVALTLFRGERGAGGGAGASPDDDPAAAEAHPS